MNVYLKDAPSIPQFVDLLCNLLDEPCSMLKAAHKLDVVQTSVGCALANVICFFLISVFTTVTHVSKSYILVS